MGTPKILSTREVARSRFFHIEEVDLRFPNGVERTYERLPARGRDAVIVVPVSANGNLLLIREYAAGFHEVQLTLPKGACDAGEDLLQAADRELQEEIGYGARRLRFVKQLSAVPGHMGFTIHVVLAQDLYPSRLAGDEPEPPEVVPWPLSNLAALYGCADFCEARAVAALALAAPLIDND